MSINIIGGSGFIGNKLSFVKQKTAYEISACLVGSEMCLRESTKILNTKH